jgi:hypothetical protein
MMAVQNKSKGSPLGCAGSILRCLMGLQVCIAATGSCVLAQGFGFEQIIFGKEVEL